MYNSKWPSIAMCSKVNKILNYAISALFVIVILITNNAHANFESTENSATGMCPANHKMYYIGANPPASTSTSPVVSQALSWTAGNATSTFTFNEPSGSKTFNINFSSILDRNNSQGTPPFYGSINGSTSSALNLVHDSTSTVTNHILNISINRSVSKTGYRIQDLDSLRFFWTQYIEQVDVSANNGRLTFSSIFHNINPQNDVVTAKEDRNCDTGQCNIDASWGYKAANSVFNLKHNNTLNENNFILHIVGYSDFYFCLAPPKLIVKKALNGNRVNDTDTKRDQFEIKVTGGSVAANSFTTAGTGATISNDSSATLSLESTSYTITERAMNGASLGDIAGYDAAYTCTNATTGSTTVMPTTAMTYNAKTKTRSFTLANTTYGDEITCTITNTPKSYTFSGTVFNDNGEIPASDNTKFNVSPTFTNNQNYFNGIFDSNESGIGSSGLQVRLTNCDPNGGTNITGTTVQNISQTSSPLGRYKFTVPANVIAALSPQKVCIVQVEPNTWDYAVDTTTNNREVTLISSVYDYSNLDFGEVQANNASLVLIKSQYVHSCNINANYNGSSGTPSQTPLFITTEIKDIEPGKCIAYRVEAYNRGHVDLKDIQITDILQTTPIKSVFFSPSPLGDPITINNNVNTLPVDKIISNKFDLLKPTGSSPTKATLYFNTKYGTTVNAQ